MGLFLNYVSFQDFLMLEKTQILFLVTYLKLLKHHFMYGPLMTRNQGKVLNKRGPNSNVFLKGIIFFTTPTPPSLPTKYTFTSLSRLVTNMFLPVVLHTRTEFWFSDPTSRKSDRA